DRIVAEEGTAAATGGLGGLRWFIDPLDGTVNFLYGHPQWCVSIACEDEAGLLAGVVFDPVRDELFGAARGAGARLNGAALAVREPGSLGLALVSTGFSYRAEERLRQGRILAPLIGRVRDVRRGGSTALDLAWVAAGRTDAFYESISNTWDWAAGALLVREAGGVVTEIAGASGGEPRIVASAPGVHRALLDALRDAVAEARTREST
ncbi:MAG: inositol monophosphatase, partial [Chloroflexi bacterium]|nr:inositol monophosphatase [Chloroflexota bacterium]